MAAGRQLAPATGPREQPRGKDDQPSGARLLVRCHSVLSVAGSAYDRAEWSMRARGVEDKPYVWGDDDPKADARVQYLARIFPYQNAGTDGISRPARARVSPERYGSTTCGECLGMGPDWYRADTYTRGG